MLMRRQTTGPPPLLARGLAPFSSSKMVPDPNSTDPNSGAPVSVVSTFVSFLRAIQRNTEQVHLAQDFLGSTQHGAAAPAFRYHQQQRIELRRERQHVIRRQQRGHVVDNDAARHLTLQGSGELTHAW